MLTKKEMWPVMLTPFTERGEVDYNALERLIAFRSMRKVDAAACLPFASPAKCST